MIFHDDFNQHVMCSPSLHALQFSAQCTVCACTSSLLFVYISTIRIPWNNETRSPCGFLFKSSSYPIYFSNLTWVCQTLYVRIHLLSSVNHCMRSCDFFFFRKWIFVSFFLFCHVIVMCTEWLKETTNAWHKESHSTIHCTHRSLTLSSEVRT